MAKKINKIEEEKKESVANSSQSEAAKSSGDNLPAKVVNIDRANVDIESLIRTIRGQKVMVDFDLAMLYGVQNKRLNEQVKRNIKRFPSDFMFQLTKEEWNILKSQIATAKQADNQVDVHLKSQFATSSWGGSRKLPNAFTREGIGMLSSVLGSDTAIEMNIRIMRVFTAAHQIMENNAILFKRVLNLEQHQQETDKKIDHLITKMDENSPKILPEKIFQAGCVWDAWTYVSDLVRSAKMEIVLIDNYVDDRVLTMLTKRGDGVKATILTRYDKQFITDLEKHNKQYAEIHLEQLAHKNHDRFLIIDDKVYFLGSSLKDMAEGFCSVSEMGVSPAVILKLIREN